jgi:hypothetical protein
MKARLGHNLPAPLRTSVVTAAPHKSLPAPLSKHTRGSGRVRPRQSQHIIHPSHVTKNCLLLRGMTNATRPPAPWRCDVSATATSVSRGCARTSGSPTVNGLDRGMRCHVRATSVTSAAVSSELLVFFDALTSHANSTPTPVYFTPHLWRLKCPPDRARHPQA